MNAHPALCSLHIAALLAAALWAQGAAAQPAAVELSAQTVKIEVWPRIEVLTDVSPQVDVRTVAALTAEAWQPIPRRHHHWGPGGPQVMWARLSLHNHSATFTQWMLVHEQSFVDRVQVWHGAGADWQEIVGTREADPRWMSGTHNPAFALELAPGARMNLLVRADTLSYLRFPLHVVEAGAYHRQARGDYLTRGMVGVIPLVASFFILLLWLVTREHSLLVFTGMILCEVVGAAWIGGLLHVMLPWVSSQALGNFCFIALLGAISFGLTHARLFLNLDAAMPRMARSFRLITWLLPLAALPDLMGIGTGRNVAILVWFACTQMLFAVSLLRARQGQPFAGTYALAWGTYLVSASLIIINMTGLIAPNVSNMTLFAQGSIVSLVFCYATVGQVRVRELATQSALLREHAALEMSRARTRLFAATNHDMRQPVQSLGLFIELLRTRKSDTDVDTIARRLRAAYLSLSDFLDGLMSAVQLESGTLKPQWSEFALKDLLEPLVDEYREQARAKHLALRYIPSSVKVRSDRVLLERILRNLLANAVRYTESGRLLMGVRRRGGGRLSIQVLDTGVGFSPAAQGRAFSEFKRFADGSDGVGLGLANVRGLCQLLGHQVELRTRAGRGSCFSVTLDEAPPSALRQAA